MKRQLCLSVLTAALACGALYAGSSALQADVPFRFAIGDTAMPAGEYRITWQNGVVSVREAGGRHAAMTMAKPTLSEKSFAQRQPGKGVLLFQRYGDEYFLTGVLTPSSREGLALPAGVRQKELASRKTGSEATTIASKK